MDESEKLQVIGKNRGDMNQFRSDHIKLDGKVCDIASHDAIIPNNPMDETLMDVQGRILHHVNFPVLANQANKLVKIRRLLAECPGHDLKDVYFAKHHHTTSMLPLEIIAWWQNCLAQRGTFTLDTMQGTVPSGLCAVTDQIIRENMSTLQCEVRACTARLRVLQCRRSFSNTAASGEPSGPSDQARFNDGSIDIFPLKTSASQKTSKKTKENAACRPPKFYQETYEKLMKWMLDHYDHPYPTKSAMKALATHTGKTDTQVEDWIQNRRKRNVNGKIAQTKKMQHLLDFVAVMHVFKRIKKVVQFVEPPTFQSWWQGKCQVHILLKSKKWERAKEFAIISVGTNPIGIDWALPPIVEKPLQPCVSACCDTGGGETAHSAVSEHPSADDHVLRGHSDLNPDELDTKIAEWLLDDDFLIMESSLRSHTEMNSTPMESEHPMQVDVEFEIPYACHDPEHSNASRFLNDDQNIDEETCEALRLLLAKDFVGPPSRPLMESEHPTQNSVESKSQRPCNHLDSTTSTDRVAVPIPMVNRQIHPSLTDDPDEEARQARLIMLTEGCVDPPTLPLFGFDCYEDSLITHARNSRGGDEVEDGMDPGTAMTSPALLELDGGGARGEEVQAAKPMIGQEFKGFDGEGAPLDEGVHFDHPIEAKFLVEWLPGEENQIRDDASGSIMQLCSQDGGDQGATTIFSPSCFDLSAMADSQEFPQCEDSNHNFAHHYVSHNEDRGIHRWLEM